MTVEELHFLMMVKKGVDPHDKKLFIGSDLINSRHRSHIFHSIDYTQDFIVCEERFINYYRYIYQLNRRLHIIGVGASNTINPPKGSFRNVYVIDYTSMADSNKNLIMNMLDSIDYEFCFCLF